MRTPDMFTGKTKLEEIEDMVVEEQEPAVLTADVLQASLDPPANEIPRVGAVRLERHHEALMREMAGWLLEDIQSSLARGDARDQQLALITTAFRSLVRRLTTQT